MISQDKFTGCFFGLAIGDAYGASYEGGLLERLLWKIIGKTKNGKLRYTDDTQMSLDIAQSYLELGEINQDHLAQRFAESYQWTRGYGSSAGKLLTKIKRGADWKDVNRLKFKEGSLGNGAGMRAPIVALCFPNDISLLNENIIKASEITHAHPLGIEGAQLIALVVQSALKDDSVEIIMNVLIKQCTAKAFYEKLSLCKVLLEQDEINVKEIRNKLGNSIIATESCITAVYFGLKFKNKDIDLMLEKIFEMRGDTDTIGAMAGAIWGAFNGCSALEKKIKKVENAEIIQLMAKQLHARSNSNKAIAL